MADLRLTEHLESLPLVGPHQMEQWSKDLRDDRFAVRQKAAAELEKWGDWAEPVLRQTLAGKPPLEVRCRVEALLQKLSNNPELFTCPEWLRALRVLETLERINTLATHQVFETLAKGPPHAWLTQEAQAARERLANRVAHKKAKRGELWESFVLERVNPK